MGIRRDQLLMVTVGAKMRLGETRLDSCCLGELLPGEFVLLVISRDQIGQRLMIAISTIGRGRRKST